MVSGTDELPTLYLSQKAFAFGEKTSAVLHRDVQCSSVELHDRNIELKPDQTERNTTDTNLNMSLINPSRLLLLIIHPLFNLTKIHDE